MKSLFFMKIFLLISLVSNVLGFSEESFNSELGKSKRDTKIPMHGASSPRSGSLLKLSKGELIELPKFGSLKLPPKSRKTSVSNSMLQVSTKNSELKFSGEIVGEWKSDSGQATFSIWSSHSSLIPGQALDIVVRIGLADGWHLYGEGEAVGKVTDLSIVSGEFRELGKGLSASVIKTLDVGEQKIISHYLIDGSYAWIRLSLREDLVLPKSLKLKLEMSYQLCSEEVCLLPTSDSIGFDLGVGVSRANALPQKFEKVYSLIKPIEERGNSSDRVEFSDASSRIDQIIQGNAWFALIMAFLWGFLASLTPCVYPMIPITVSLFASDSGNQSRVSRIGSAFLYVIGIALVYAILGLVTSRTGRDLGSWLAEPIVVVPLTFLMLMLALSMFGLFEMDLPNSIKSRLNKIEGRSPITLLLMGGAMGFVAAPCVGPFAGSIILWLAKNPGNPIFGFLLMASFGLGMGSLFVLIALFSQEILPRSGVWMVKLKQSMGYLLIGMAYYFSTVLLPDDCVRVGWAVYVIIAGGLLGAFAQLSWEDIWWKHLLKTVGVCLFLVGIFQLWSINKPSMVSTKIASQDTKTIFNDFDEAYEASRKSKKPLFLYFSAKWCIPCKKIKSVVLKDENIIKALDRFEVVYLDCTSADSKSARLKESRFKSHSMPFFAFFDTKGRHMKSLDIHGSIDVPTLIQQLDKVK